MNEKAPPVRKRATYDRLASHYDDAMGPLERWFLTHLRASTLSELPANGRILELGAGTGLNFPFTRWRRMVSLAN